MQPRRGFSFFRSPVPRAGADKPDGEGCATTAGSRRRGEPVRRAIAKRNTRAARVLPSCPAADFAVAAEAAAAAQRPAKGCVRRRDGVTSTVQQPPWPLDKSVIDGHTACAARVLQSEVLEFLPPLVPFLRRIRFLFRLPCARSPHGPPN